MPTHVSMDDDLQILSDAMIIKERLRLLADIQASYWRELMEQGFEQQVAEQLLMDWSRFAFGMTTLRDRQAPSLEDEIDDLLGSLPPAGTKGTSIGMPAGTTSSGDPSSVPPGEPWLQLVQDEEPSDDADSEADDERRAA
ncbi:MAG: hypothetical protein ABI200_06185 [Gaiellales bacterium]